MHAMRILIRACTIGLLCVLTSFQSVRAEEVLIAVAANFLGPLRALQSEFEAETGHRVLMASGSTGQLYAQIVNGAPFDLLLAADRERPHLLTERGFGDPASVFTYAMGRLALWSREPDRVDRDTLGRLAESNFRYFAIAEPNVAPYGAAARQALGRLGVWESLEPRIVKGQNIAQTFAWIETGNAELGLVALSQVLAYDGPASHLIVPAELYDPVRQDAVLLLRASRNPAAREFLEFLKSSVATAIIEAHGYLAANPAE